MTGGRHAMLHDEQTDRIIDRVVAQFTRRPPHEVTRAYIEPVLQPLTASFRVSKARRNLADNIMSRITIYHEIQDYLETHQDAATLA